jgi:hypothetical protein
MDYRPLGRTGTLGTLSDLAAAFVVRRRDA